MRSALAGLWYVIAAILFVLAVTYLTLHILAGISPLFVVGAIAFIFAIPLLFLGEGSEVAVAMLIDKDPDQFDFSTSLKREFIKLWRSKRRNPPAFIIGRQLIVVFAVVVLTFLCGKLAELPSLDTSNPGFGGQLHEQLVTLNTQLREPGVVLAFEVAFPIFLALWIAQLPSKLIAHQDPLRTFSWSLTRYIVSCSLVFGSRLQVERLSLWLTSLVLRAQSAPGESLLPGRRHYYETSALLRGGRALNKAEITVTIGKDGAVTVQEAFEFHAFAEGLQQIPQRVFWEEPFVEYAPVKFTKWPDGIGEAPFTPGVPSEKPEMKDGGKMHVLEWDVQFQRRLPIGADIAFELYYKTGPRAMDIKLHDDNEYFYNVYQVPTKEVIVHIVPAPDAPFVLLERPVEAVASEEAHVNDREASRVEVITEKRGLRFRVCYPLLNTRFAFKWEMAAGSGIPVREN